MKSFLIALSVVFATGAGAQSAKQVDILKLGKPSSGLNKIIEFNKGSGSANPKIRLNVATGKLEFSNDGSTFYEIGPNGVIPPGLIAPFSGDHCPAGWSEVDGQPISRTTYSDLFAYQGTIVGEGDGSTTFNKPDWRGRFIRAWDHGASRDPDSSSRTAMATGGNTGDAAGSVQGDQFKAHTHVSTTLRTFGGYSSTVPSATGQPSNVLRNDATSGFTDTTSSAGGSETRPTNVNAIFCMKL